VRSKKNGQGGAGFRYISRLFAGKHSIIRVLRANDLSNEMTAIGDIWRELP